MSATPVYDFDLANAAFDRLTNDERRRALYIMANLEFPAIEDRFFEAIFRVINQKDGAAKAEGR